MVKTQDYRTKTVSIETTNVKPNTDDWPIALDVGYSGVKGFSPYRICSFPSYAKNLGTNPKFYGQQAEDEILYVDNDTHECWRVGRSAQQMVDIRNTEESQLELFGRDRYFSPMFPVLIRTGLAFNMLNYGRDGNNPTISVQTGLPPAYVDEDSEYIIDKFSGDHHFSIKTGTMKSFMNFSIHIDPENVHVMSQPEGTLMSVAYDNNGRPIPEAKKLYQSNLVIVDAGFGTFDTFDIRNRSKNGSETFSDYGMKAILQKCVDKIKQEKAVVIPLSAIQNYLETGFVPIRKRDSNGRPISKSFPFAEELEASMLETGEEAIKKLQNVYSGFDNYQYLILTGGTCAPWEPQIREAFSGIEDLKILTGNMNCPDLDMIFCNVRGYYMYLVNYLAAKAAAKL